MLFRVFRGVIIQSSDNNTYWESSCMSYRYDDESLLGLKNIIEAVSRYRLGGHLVDNL